MKASISSFGFAFFLLLSSNPAQANANCDFSLKSQNLCASLQWLTVPSGMASGSFRLSFFAKDKDPGVLVAPNAAKVGVKLFMPEMGHGGGLVKVNPTLGANGNLILGQFDATEVNFMMHGHWQIIVQLKDEALVAFDSAQIDYEAN